MTSIPLDDVIIAKRGATMTLSNIAVFWRFENLGSDTYITLDKAGVKTQVAFQKGYWDFSLIFERLGEEGITLTANKHNNTCRVHTPNDTSVNLGDIGPLLGFPERTRQ